MADVVDRPAPGSAAAELFGAAFGTAQQYARLLTGMGVQRGVVGPAEAGRIWDRHLLNCAAVGRLVPARCTLVDLGSGAGLPGLVLAMLLPGAQVTLLEALARRSAFLQECVSELGLRNVEVVRGRAEEFAGRMAADVVCSRAVAPLDKLAGLSAGLARPGGRVIAIKGASAESELARARPALSRLGVVDARVSQVSSADGAAAATVVMFTVPQRRGSSTARRTARPEAGPGGRASGRRDPSAAAGRVTRPNSRRAG